MHVDKAQTLFSSVHSTGELRGIEQSMIVETSAGNVVVVGCAHPGLETIIPAAQKFGPIHALIGGFHGFDKINLLEDIGYVCPTHCTRRIEAIAKRYPEKYLPGGTGRQYEFPLTHKPKEVR
ncbi:MAG: hypothetical protein U5N26_00395 [Candidatus Marinimicrobia bacterium]|nr:hypothetical protein [Candidatus Neomarinimicrobiota bacterium]